VNGVTLIEKKEIQHDGTIGHASIKGTGAADWKDRGDRLFEGAER
jgi:hypothetical protein